MLMHLSIRDFAIIDCASIEFHEGFSVVTGERRGARSRALLALSRTRDNCASAAADEVIEVWIVRRRLEHVNVQGHEHPSST